MDWPAHPDDEWVEVTSFGELEPRFILGESGAAKAIARARAAYVGGKIELEEFERRIEEAIRQA